MFPLLHNSSLALANMWFMITYCIDQDPQQKQTIYKHSNKYVWQPQTNKLKRGHQKLIAGFAQFIVQLIIEYILRLRQLPQW